MSDNARPESGMRRDIEQKWGKFSAREIAALKDNDDLVMQIQTKYQLDKLRRNATSLSSPRGDSSSHASPSQGRSWQDLMAPNNQNGGGRGPWGQGRFGGPRSRRDLEELLKRGQDKLKQVMPGGSGFSAHFLSGGRRTGGDRCVSCFHLPR